MPTGREMLSHGEADPPTPPSSDLNLPQQQQQQHKSNGGGGGLSSLGRQSSIYSLTLDEFQHTLCDGGRNFGSMNMDEFLNSIWTAEENQQQAATAAAAAATTELSLSDGSASRQPPAGQQGLNRQNSLSLPAPLSRKTVEEVWSEIHQQSHVQQRQKGNEAPAAAGAGAAAAGLPNPGSAPRHPTFGEMTLEDFLIKAGVVQESSNAAAAPQPQQFGMYHGTSPRPPPIGPAGPTFLNRPVMGFGAGGPPAAPSAGGGVQPYQAVPPGFAGNGKGSAGYQPPAMCYGGGGRDGGGYAVAGGGTLAMVSPVSPVSSSDGMCGNNNNHQVDGGMDVGGLRGGRKRVLDGPVEKVVERRQRRMIKNRESAARSRARKQAYTVELEAELNQLREENTHLKQALVELERKRKQQYLEELKAKAHTRMVKREKLRTLKRNLSCPL